MIARTAVVALLVVGFAGPVVADAPKNDEVARSIAEGIEWVRGRQGPEGSWSYAFNHDHTLGITALAGLALLENGVSRDDSAIKRAERVVENLATESDQTYDVALAILFLARVQATTTGPHDALIQSLAGRLEAGGPDGMWSYPVPLETNTGRGRDRTRRRGAAGLLSLLGGGDNSNTQFALLGIWAAGRHGFDSNEALEAIDRHFRSSQDASGAWGYHRQAEPGNAMTCAGLMGLAISAARPKQAERLTARARGAALAADEAFQKGLAAVARDASRIGPNSDVYYLWSLERVCVALGLRELDGLDWYAAGASELLRRQRGDGSWPESQWGALPDTCLALLFLRKANLAFELDRVLKLPDPGRPRRGETPEATPPPAEEAAEGDDGVRVAVRSIEDDNFPNITIDFEVKRPDGTALLDARREDFRVEEGGRPVDILEFVSPVSTEVRPTTVVMVVDRSLSMEEEDRIASMKGAVDTFLEVMPAGSVVAVVAFGSDVTSLCPFTNDPARVREAIKPLAPAGATRYYDAVSEALRMIEQQGGRRAVLALTDGEDTFSRDATLESVIVAARTAGVPVHTLGLGSEDEIEADALRRLASETRGRYFAAEEAGQLRGIYEELARDLGQSYSLTYRTDRTLPDGTLRPIRIAYRQASDAAEAQVFIRGMVVPAPGWSGLFLALVTALLAGATLLGRAARRPSRG